MAETPTTELEAVNLILAWNGDNPVNSLTDPDSLELSKAVSALTEKSREVQMAGWSFNFETEYPLSTNAQGKIPLPTNALYVDPCPKAGNVDFVERDRHLYDRKNHTFLISGGTFVDITFFLPFDELPEHARRFIALEAAMTFLSRDLGEQEVARLLNLDLSKARAEFLRRETKAMDTNMKKNAFMRDIIDPHGYTPRSRMSLKI